MNALISQIDTFWRIFLALPVTTQWAVTLLFVSGLIVHIFAYSERMIYEGPSIFTTGGIFFTFVGIAEGLYGFDPQKIDASIPVLLDGLKTAFIASVFGVGVALSIKLRYSFFGLPKGVNTTPSGGASVDDLFKQMVAVQQALVGDDDSTLLSQIKLTRQDSNDRLDKIRQSQAEFMQKMAENNSKALIQALQEVIREFNQKISEQFGENFKQLNEAVGRLLVWQESYRVQLTESVNLQTRTAENMKIASDRYEIVVSRTESFATTAEQLSVLLRGLETQATHLDAMMRSLAQLLTAASESLPQVEKKIVTLTEQVTNGVKQNQVEMTKTVRDTAVAFQASVADLKTLLQETIQSTNRQVGDHMSQLTAKTNEQIVKLDAALELALSNSISSLGQQLTALSGRFVEDYAPLTERLRLIVQMARGV